MNIPTPEEALKLHKEREIKEANTIINEYTGLIARTILTRYDPSFPLTVDFPLWESRVKRTAFKELKKLFSENWTLELIEKCTKHNNSVWDRILITAKGVSLPEVVSKKPWWKLW